jgi:F-type H+-transporting ATPase subunit gamma
MAGGQERALRRRVRSNQNIKKITHAMELIAASRIAKDQQRVAAARPYAELMTTVVAHLTRAGGNLDQPLLATREVGTVGLVVVTADKGLAGGYNANVTRAADQAMAEARRDGRQTRLYVAGKKGLNYFRFRNVPVEQEWSGFSELPRAEDARAIAQSVRTAFEDGVLDRVELISTRFRSLGSQQVETSRLLPLDPSMLAGAEDDRATAGEPHAEYEFEPEPDAILERLLPLYVESRVYAALLEAAASEHAARQRAMKSATDNATDLIAIYQRRANRVRQEAITTELVEVTGAAAALAAGS